MTKDQGQWTKDVPCEPRTPTTQANAVTVDRKPGCSACFFPASFPGLSIGPDGKCELCSAGGADRVAPVEPTLGMDALRDAAEELRQQRKGRYDCVVGASGGLDSSYVILLAKVDLDLNPLVVSYDAGFSHGVARRNLETLCRRLKVDLRIVRSRGRNDFKYVRSTVRALRNLDAYWGICDFCHYVLDAVIHRCALAEQVPAVLTSHNVYEDELRLPGDFRLRYMLGALRRCRVWKLPSALLHLILARYHLLRLMQEFYVPPPSNLIRRSTRPARRVPRFYVSDYVAWDIDHMVDRLQREAGWTTSSHPNLRMRFDCMIEDSFINHTYRKATGLTVHALIANNLVHHGVRTKAELADVVEYYDNAISGTMEELLSQLGLRRWER